MSGQKRLFGSKKYDLPGWNVLYFPKNGRRRDCESDVNWASDGSYFILGVRHGRRDKIIPDYQLMGNFVIKQGKGKRGSKSTTTGAG